MDVTLDFRIQDYLQTVVALWTLQYHHTSPYCFPVSFSFISYRLAGSEEEEEEGQWQLYFKLYCFLDIENVPKDGVEFAFMFEQVSQLWENDFVSKVGEAHKRIQKTGLPFIRSGNALCNRRI